MASGAASRREGDRARAAGLLAALEAAYPGAGCALRHDSALELLVATILSAQCTDTRVNLVTEGLFRRYRRAEDYAAAPPGVLEAEIRSTGFFNSKARSLRGMAALLVERHGGRVPETMEALLELPGVARKTANVVLGSWFGKNAGVVVDTHVRRLAGRLGLSRCSDPVKIEADLMDLFPSERWTFLAHALIAHGRTVCLARKPRCAECSLERMCPRVGVEKLPRSH